ncbi:MAG TPA: hypothetical protein VHW00_07220 [Thermoanaerobaculia bacterium]|nr:hypothetical protein [Thermoanaerobaculia bacterium]
MTRIILRFYGRNDQSEVSFRITAAVRKRGILDGLLQFCSSRSARARVIHAARGD